MVADRSALFSAMSRLRTGTTAALAKGACSPLELRIRSVLLEMDEKWQASAASPSWRLNQLRFPERWNVVRPASDAATKSKRMCDIAYVSGGVVGVDIKSHQDDGEPCPYPVVVAGNAAVDQACDEARAQRQPPDVMLPSGGWLVFAVVQGRMITPRLRWRSVEAMPSAREDCCHR